MPARPAFFAKNLQNKLWDYISPDFLLLRLARQASLLCHKLAQQALGFYQHLLLPLTARPAFFATNLQSKLFISTINRQT
jgi:hypothetical protein